MSDTAPSAETARELVHRVVEGVAASLGPAITGGRLGGDRLAVTVTVVGDGVPVEIWGGHIAALDRFTDPDGDRDDGTDADADAGWATGYAADYAAARAKTALTLRTGLTAEEVHRVQPELLAPGDVPNWGNTALDLGGVRVVVSASGLDEAWDQRVCEAVADVLAISLGDDPKALLAAS